MDKEHFQKLTLAVYRVTEFFPEKEPLRFQIRELAGRILANLVLANPHPENIANKGDLIKDIDVLCNYFDLADVQNWVDPRNFVVLKDEYGKVQRLAEEISILDGFNQQVPSAELASCDPNQLSLPEIPDSNHNASRQDKILEEINRSGMVKIGDLIKLFPGVNRRTVLRDIDKICQTGAAVRNGNGRGAHYIKNGHNHDVSH